jgi:hypothetical protein
MTDQGHIPPYQWCWRCGQAVPNGFVRRRVVQTGSGRGTSYGTTLHVTDMAFYQPVSLCPRCDEEITEEEVTRERARAARGRWWWRLGLGTWLAIALTFAGVPALVAVAVAGGIAWIGVPGRAVLMLHVMAALAEEMGWAPQHHPVVFLPLWGISIGTLAAWKHRLTIKSWFGFGGTSIERDATGRPVIPTRAKEVSRE